MLLMTSYVYGILDSVKTLQIILQEHAMVLLYIQILFSFQINEITLHHTSLSHNYITFYIKTTKNSYICLRQFQKPL